MIAPIGAEVGLYVDLAARVAVGDIIETQTGRRYGVLSVRVQETGKYEGRQHLRCVVMDRSDPVVCAGTFQTHPHNVMCLMCGERGQMCDRKLYTIRWYKRGRGRK